MAINLNSLGLIVMYYKDGGICRSEINSYNII